jgi:rRNA-processing protein FCF1
MGDKIAIQDACILIDLIEMKLMDHCLQIPFSFCTTELVLAELYEEQKNTIANSINTGKLSIIAIEENALSEIISITNNTQKLTIEDISVYYYASQNNALLLTGDKVLRTLAQNNGIESAGILFIFDQLVLHNILTKKEAGIYLMGLYEKNKRLPREECVRRIREWLGLEY